MKPKIAVVVGLFNREVTEKLEQGALDYLKSQDFTKDQIFLEHVPGAVEIPLIAKAYLDKGVDGVIAIGAVIRGETTHYESVCNSVERGCTLLQIEYAKPVTFGVITTENEEQAFDRCGGKHGNKGRDAAETCLQMINLLRKIKEEKI